MYCVQKYTPCGNTISYWNFTWNQKVLRGAAAEVDKSKTFSFLGLLGVPFPEDNETPEPLEDDDEDGVAFVTFKELVGMRLVAEASEEAVEAEFNAPGDDWSWVDTSDKPLILRLSAVFISEANWFWKKNEKYEFFCHTLILREISIGFEH